MKKKNRKSARTTQNSAKMWQTIHSGCTKKRRYSSEVVARNAADIQELITMGLELSVYHCEWCGGWHLTRNSDDMR